MSAFYAPPLQAAPRAIRESRPEYTPADEMALSRLWQSAHSLADGLLTADGRRWDGRLSRQALHLGGPRLQGRRSGRRERRAGVWGRRNPPGRTLMVWPRPRQGSGIQRGRPPRSIPHKRRNRHQAALKGTGTGRGFRPRLACAGKRERGSIGGLAYNGRARDGARPRPGGSRSRPTRLCTVPSWRTWATPPTAGPFGS